MYQLLRQLHVCVCLPGYDVINDCAPQPRPSGNDDSNEGILPDGAAIAMFALGCLMVVGAIVTASVACVCTRKRIINQRSTATKRHKDATSDEKLAHTELYEIAINPQAPAERGVSQTYESMPALETSAGESAADDVAAHVYEVPEPDKIYINTQTEASTYTHLTS